MLLIASSIILNQSHVFPLLLSQILEGVKISDQKINNFSVGYFASGIVGGFLFNYIVTRRKCSFQCLNIFIVLMCTMSLIIFHWVFNYANQQIEDRTHIIKLEDLNNS